MTQGEPAVAAGACGSRISRQSALASGAIRELSWAGSGVATGAVRAGGRASRAGSRRARRWPAGRGRARPASVARSISARPAEPPDQRHQEQEGADIGRHRVARQPSTCMAPSRPCIIGRPGRSATRQNDSVEPFGGERLLHQIVLADRGAAGGHQNIGAAVARAADRRGDVLDPVAARCRDRSTSAPSLRAMRDQRQSRWNRRSRPGRASLPGATSSSPVPSTATFGRRCTGTVGWFMAAASIEVAVGEAAALAQQRPAPCAKSMPWRAHIAALGASASGSMTRVAVARGDFLDHHGVGAGRHHAAGEDARGLAGADVRRRTDGRRRLRRSA